MKFKFIGNYTNGADSITMFGPEVAGKRPSATFTERAATDVTDKDLVRRLSNNPEFQKVGKGRDEDLSDPHDVPTASEEALAEAAKAKK
jgi:hypothetical protein